MIDLYLRAGNAGAMANACPFLRHEDAEGERHWRTVEPGFILDVIGDIVLQEAKVNRLGVQTHAAIIDERFHLNLRCTEEVAEQVPDTVRVYPATPRRHWA